MLVACVAVQALEHLIALDGHPARARVDVREQRAPRRVRVEYRPGAARVHDGQVQARLRPGPAVAADGPALAVDPHDAGPAPPPPLPPPRRFCRRPSSVSLEAMGSSSPFPEVMRRPRAIPWEATASAAARARRSERPRL